MKAALEEGTLPYRRYESWVKLRSEAAYMARRAGQSASRRGAKAWVQASKDYRRDSQAAIVCPDMEDSVHGSSVLVTGASRGIGAATAHAFAADGDRVAVHYGSSRDAAEAVLADLPGDGARAGPRRSGRSGWRSRRWSRASPGRSAASTYW